jgi:hypothetical protein
MHAHLVTLLDGIDKIDNTIFPHPTLLDIGKKVLLPNTFGVTSQPIQH